MRFRPSYYSQVQLTTYAPNGGYPGFYGGEEDDSAKEAEKAKAEEDFNAAKMLCDSMFDPKKGPGQAIAHQGCVSAAQSVLDAAMEKIEQSITTALGPNSTPGGGGTQTPKGIPVPPKGGRPGTLPPGTKNVPANLTADEKALLEACLKKPMRVRYSCVNAAIAKIKADREAAKKGTTEGSNTLWWVIGGVAVAGGAYVLWRRLG
jgi:hypothetical protein